MISRRVKALFYFSMALPMWISGRVYRHVFAPRTAGARTVKVHLGPGQDGYRPNWINVDANIVTARLDVWADLRHRLPFPAKSVDVFYSHHVIEHLPNDRLQFHCLELFRCLKPGGIIRIGGPNGDEAIRNYLANNNAWFSDFPDKRESIGGRLDNFLLCRGEHLTILTLSYLGELLQNSGFVNIAFRQPVSDTGYPALLGDVLAGESESHPQSPHTLLVEALKPA